MTDKPKRLERWLRFNGDGKLIDVHELEPRDVPAPQSVAHVREVLPGDPDPDELQAEVDRLCTLHQEECKQAAMFRSDLAAANAKNIDLQAEVERLREKSRDRLHQRWDDNDESRQRIADLVAENTRLSTAEKQRDELREVLSNVLKPTNFISLEAARDYIAEVLEVGNYATPTDPEGE